MLTNIDNPTGPSPEVGKRTDEILREFEQRNKPAGKADIVLTLPQATSTNVTKITDRNWRASHRATKDKRTEGYQAALNWLMANGEPVEFVQGYKANAHSRPVNITRCVAPIVEKCRVELRVWNPNRKSRDVHNTDCKAWFDGITDANLWPDDNDMVIPIVTYRAMGMDKLNPRVEFHIFKLP